MVRIGLRNRNTKTINKDIINGVAGWFVLVVVIENISVIVFHIFV